MTGNCCMARTGLKLFVVAAALITGTALITREAVRADDPPKAGDKGAGGHEMSAEDKAMMDKWMAAGTPGPNHKHLDAYVGTWDTVTKMQMDPAAPAEESTGKATFKWILDGRYLTQDFEGAAMGAPFKGIGLMGYDNLRKEYVSIWGDSMSTAVMVEYGKADAAGKVITSEGECTDPMTGKPQKSKSIHRVIDANKHVFEMYGPDKTSKMFKSLEVTYTRAK